MRGDLGAVQRARAGVQAGHVGPGRFDAHVGPHAGQYLHEAEAGRSVVDLGHLDLARGGHTPGHDEEGGGGGIAGHGALDRAQRRGAHRHHPALAPGLDCHVGARFHEHLFGVGARGDGLADDGVARGRQARQQNGRLHLGAGHLGRPVDAVQCASLDVQRRQAALAPALHLGPHEAERFGHPVHGPGRERLVTDEFAGPGQAGDEAGQEPHGGARIAAVERVVRGMEQAAPAVQHDRPVGPAFHGDAHGFDRAQRGRHVSPIGEAVHNRGALGQSGEQHRAMRDRLLPRGAHGAPAGHAALDDERGRCDGRAHDSGSTRQR